MKILLAADGSRYALDAARFLTRSAPADGSVEIDLVSAIPLDGSMPARELEAGSRAGIDREPARTAGLRETERILVDAGYPLRSRTLLGDPREALVREADDYDLVVVGVKGRGAAPFFELGSVARAVVRHAPCSVLLVRRRRSPTAALTRSDATGPIRVLIPTDGAEDGLAAAWEAFSPLAGAPAEIEVLTVVDPEGVEFTVQQAAGTLADSTIAKRTRATRWLGDAINGLGPTALPPRSHLLEGRPGAEIERRALETEADLIVMGVRGKGRPGPGPLGSTARELAWRAPCSVLMARDKKIRPVNRLKGRLQNRLEGLQGTDSAGLPGSTQELEGQHPPTES